MKVDHNSKRLSGSKVLITGATSGLGFSISIALAKEGAEVADSTLAPEKKPDSGSAAADTAQAQDGD